MVIFFVIPATLINFYYAFPSKFLFKIAIPRFNETYKVDFRTKLNTKLFIVKFGKGRLIFFFKSALY